MNNPLLSRNAPIGDDRRRRRRITVLLLLAGLVMPSALGAAAPTEPLALAGHATLLLDGPGEMTLADAVAALDRGDFRPLQPWQTRFGYTRATLWLHLVPPEELANLQRFMVLIEPAMLDELRLFHVRDGQLITDTILELAAPFATRPIPNRALLLPVSGFDTGVDTLMLSVRTRGNLAVNGAYATDAELMAWTSDADVASASLFGAMVVLLMLTTLLFMLTRVLSLAYLGMFIAANAGHYAVAHGTIAQWAPDQAMPWAHEFYILCIFASGIAAIMFTREALVLPRATPRLDHAIRILAGITLLGAVCIPLVGTASAYRIAGVLALIANPVLIAAAVLRWRQGDRSARTLVLAWSLLLAGVMLMTLHRAGILPVALVDEDDTYLLSVLCAVLLTFAMVQRLLLLQEEPDTVDAALRDGLHSSLVEGDRMAEDLASSVQARNRELRTANERLELVRAETERHAQTLNTLFASSVGIHSAGETDDLLRACLAQLADLFPDHGFGIVIQGERPSDVRYRHFTGLDEATEQLIIDNAHLLSESVRGTLRNMLDASEQRGRGAAALNWHFLALTGSHPSAGGHLLIRGPELPARDLDVLGVFCTQIATALENRRLSAQLEQLANTDPLTGVGNRTVFDRALAQAIANASSQPRIDFCVLLADVNGLKEVNDTLGHEAGDALIRHLAAALAHCVRREDRLTRSGGDEFVIVCPGASRLIADELAARIEDYIASHALTLPGHAAPVPVSLAIGTASSAETPPDQVVAAADMRMYDAKQRHYALATAGDAQTRSGPR